MPIYHTVMQFWFCLYTRDLCLLLKTLVRHYLKPNPPRFSFHTNYPNGNRYLKLPNVPPYKLIGCHGINSMTLIKVDDMYDVSPLSLH